MTPMVCRSVSSWSTRSPMRTPKLLMTPISRKPMKKRASTMRAWSIEIDRFHDMMARDRRSPVDVVNIGPGHAGGFGESTSQTRHLVGDYILGIVISASCSFRCDGLQFACTMHNMNSCTTNVTAHLADRVDNYTRSGYLGAWSSTLIKK